MRISAENIEIIEIIDNIYKNGNIKNLVNNYKDISYEKAYPALCAAGELCKDSPNISLIKILALAVYGWMPTILDNMGYTEENNKEWEKEICSSVNNIINKDGDLNKCSKDFDNLKTFVNNSYVGLSKFLHFLLPDKFAIWDSNVYIALLGWQNGVLNKILNLEKNADAKDGVIEDIIKYSGSVQAHTNKKNNFLEYEKQIINYAKIINKKPRDVEKYLFCFGKWLHNLANSLKKVDTDFNNKPENETKTVEEWKEAYDKKRYRILQEMIEKIRSV